MNKKRIGLIVDVLMYILLLVQMGYVFIGNDIHEYLGIAFFLCLIIHLSLKFHWFKRVSKHKIRIKSIRGIADIVIVVLILLLLAMIISSMGVSRTLFPFITDLNDPSIHKLLATLVLTVAVIHGGMHTLFKPKNRKRKIFIITVLAISAFLIGNNAVPYLNRHFRTVDFSSSDIKEVTKYSWKGKKPLVVYFTRVGNTNFDKNVDVVSGASLLKEDGKLGGNTEYMAKTLTQMLDVKAEPITLTDYKYPSTYADTIKVAGDELKKQARPSIESIDISSYDSIILVYPLWWGTIPMPVASFLEQNDFNNKTIYMLATQGSSGYGTSVEDTQKLVKGAKVYKAMSIYCDDVPKSGKLFEQWLNKIAIKE